MPDTAVLSTLHHITEKKLEKLDEHRTKFDTELASITKESLRNKSLDQKVRVLLQGVQNFNISFGQTGLSAKNIGRFLDQSQHDPSVSPAILNQWKTKLEKVLEIQGLKYEYARLFGKLVTEWIQNPNDAVAASRPTGSDDDSSDSEASTSFEQVGREEMHQQRKDWESYAFTARETDQAAIEKYLNDLFGSANKSKKLKKTPLQQLRDQLKDIDEVEPKKFDTPNVRSCIKALLTADLFAGAKREALADLLNRDDTLDEIADVLNMDLVALEDWEWAPQPIPLHMRRQLNGKYRVFMDEEIHQAILLQFIGSKIAALFKTSFTAFFHSGAWLVNPYNAMGKEDRLRRAFYLNVSAVSTKNDTVRNMRRNTFANDYFMTQLPDSFFAGSRDYNDDTSDDITTLDNDGRKTPIVIKQSMLRLVTTEMLINTKLYGGFTVLQSDFKWFGPSLPHSTSFAVLKFFGIKAKWLKFVKKFLEAPVAFAADGQNAEVRKRARGIPMSHTLSDALGEAILFCLDFAVNQRTKGGNIYRFHDDLWFWGQEQSCVEAWKAMGEFSKVMGMDLNEEKTGAIQILNDSAATTKPSSELPHGPVRWGFLELDAKVGRWVICKPEVEDHIKELKRQLNACRSVFAWIQAYNSYVDRFFSTNFGQPARCFGKEHVKMVIETFEHIHQRLFGANASVTGYLRKTIGERFGVQDIPDGFFYLPVELGGLELRSPFIPLFAQVRHPFIGPRKRLDIAFDAEEEEYDTYREKFENGELHRFQALDYTPKDPDTFMSLDEYRKFMEETSSHLHKAYDQLLNPSPEDVVESTLEITNALSTLPSSLTYGDSGFTRDWNSMKPYWKWLLELYAADVIQRFGGLTMGDRGLIPIALVKLLRSEKVRWQS